MDVAEESRPAEGKGFVAAARGTYVRCERDEALERAFETVWRSAADGSREARCLVLVGQTGAGKTRAIERLFSRRFGEPGPDAYPGEVVSSSMPSPATLKVWGRHLLARLGYPLRSDLREAIVWEMVRDRLAASPAHVLHFDEFQHVTQNANRLQRQVVLNTVKDLLIGAYARPFGLVLSGLPEIVDLIESDQQVRRRCLFVRFPALNPTLDADVLAQTTRKFATEAGLKAEAAASFDVSRRLVHAGNGQFGQSVDLLKAAINEALAAGAKALDTAHFAEAFAARSGNAADANPFLASDWAEIDCARVLLEADATPRTNRRGSKA